MVVINETSKYELFLAWARGDLLKHPTRDYHVLDASHRFEQYIAMEAKKQAVRKERD